MCVCLTQQHVEQPGVEVGGAAGVLAHADGRAGRRAPDGGRAGLEVGHQRLQQHLDLAVVGEVAEGAQDLGDGGRQRLLHRLLLPLGDPGQTRQQVHQVGSGEGGREGGREEQEIRCMRAEDSNSQHITEMLSQVCWICVCAHPTCISVA